MVWGIIGVGELRCWGVAMWEEFQHGASCAVHGHGVGRMHYCTVAVLGRCIVREVWYGGSYGVGVKVFVCCGVVWWQCGVVAM